MQKGSQKRQLTTWILEEGMNSTYINVSTEGFDIGIHNKGVNSVILGGSHITKNFNWSFVSEFATLQTKLEPLFSAQSALSASISALDFGLSASTKASISAINTSLSPVLESARSLSDTLANIGKLTIDTQLLATKPSYDFLNNPLCATLSTTMDSIKIGQDRLNTSLLSIGDTSISSYFSRPNQITNIGILGNMSLGALQSSVIISPVVTDKERINKLDNKVISLEEKVKILSAEKDTLSLTDITKQVAQELEKVDSELAKCFKGAMRTLIEDQNEDLVAQVAESLTRVVEKLPLRLVNESILIADEKDARIVEALSRYLNLQENNKSENCLVSQQKAFYSTLGSIRHRNPNIYKIYNNDRNRFRALVTEVETFVYILLTYKNEEN